MSGYPPDHPVTDAISVPRACCDWCGQVALVVFLRIGDWAITRSAHAGSEHPPIDPYLMTPAVTWMGEDDLHGRKLGFFIGYPDQETEILRMLSGITPDDLRAAFGSGGPPLRSGFIDPETIRLISEAAGPGPALRRDPNPDGGPNERGGPAADEPDSEVTR